MAVLEAIRIGHRGVCGEHRTFSIPW